MCVFIDFRVAIGDDGVRKFICAFEVFTDKFTSAKKHWKTKKLKE